MSDRVFVGFGFGPIQAGLFLAEAFLSKRFRRLVVAEVAPGIVAAVRASGGRYTVNVAAADGIHQQKIEGVEIFNPADAADRKRLVDAVAEAEEMATALPSVNFYDAPGASIAQLLADGLREKIRRSLPPAVLYAGENNHHAAEKLWQAVAGKLSPTDAERMASFAQFLNTVIGKMSGTAQGEKSLVPFTPGNDRAFLVEAFNRIFISRITLPGFARGISIFEEKDPILPFQEAKLFGHNATHALLGYLAHRRGYADLSQAAGDAVLMNLAREAFIEESGGALTARYRNSDPLFTPEGYRRYVEDLLVRMANPHLRDRVDRVIRDPERKLHPADRLIGTMRMALSENIPPRRYALGAAAALAMWESENPDKRRGELFEKLWKDTPESPEQKHAIETLIREAELRLNTV